jgi:hypothetical protein
MIQVVFNPRSVLVKWYATPMKFVRGCIQYTFNNWYNDFINSLYSVNHHENHHAVFALDILKFTDSLNLTVLCPVGPAGPFNSPV